MKALTSIIQHQEHWHRQLPLAWASYRRNWHHGQPMRFYAANYVRHVIGQIRQWQAAYDNYRP